MVRHGRGVHVDYSSYCFSAVECHVFREAMDTELFQTAS
jgi:hypothetical protein